MSGVIKDLGKFGVGKLVVVDVCGCSSVSFDNGLVEVGGDDAGVDVVSQRGTVLVVLREVVGEDDESCKGEGGMGA